MFIMKDKIFLHLHKCAGNSVMRALIDQLPHEIRYIMLHSVVDNIPKPFINFPLYAMVRNPYSWYESVYNFEVERVKKGIGVTAIHDVLIFDSLETKNFVSIDLFVQRAVDLKKFYEENPQYITRLQKLTLQNPSVILKRLLGDRTKISPELFDGTAYSFLVKRIGIDKSKTYQMETQMGEFLKDFDLKVLPFENVTKDKSSKLTPYAKELIAQKDHRLFELFDYDIDLF